MKKLSVFCWCLVIFLAACSQEKKDPGKVLATINNFSISEERFGSLLKFESEVDRNFRLTPESRSDFLRKIIETQLLLQEAKQRKLDEQEKFRQTIERYWESTLIRDLLNVMGDEFRRKVVVTENEISAYYQEHKDLLPEKPLAEQRQSIQKAIEDEKVAASMQSWLDQLKKTARISIDDAELRAEILGGKK